MADWAQTRTIAKNPDRFRELNPLLGEHPSVAEVNRHFARSLLLGGALAHFVPSLRTEFLATVLVVEAAVVARNHIHVGIRMTF